MSNTAAGELARRLQTAHKALGVATTALTDVINGLVDVMAREHLTAACHAGHHALCPATCACTDCDCVCECTCHLVIAGLRVPME